MAELSRGVLLSSLKFGFDSVQTGGADLSSIRTALLYWDRMCITSAAPFIVDDVMMEANVLGSLGVAETFCPLPDHHNFSTEHGPAVNTAIREKYAKLRARPGEIWVLGDGGADAQIDDTYWSMTSSNTASRHLILEVELKNALPLPERETPYEDILEFKHRRREELRRLHHQIDVISATYAAHPDEQEPVTRALEVMRSCLADLEKVYSEKWPILDRRSYVLAATAGFGAIAGHYTESLVGLGSTMLAPAVGAAVSAYVQQITLGKPKSDAPEAFAYALAAKEL